MIYRSCRNFQISEKWHSLLIVNNIKLNLIVFVFVFQARRYLSVLSQSLWGSGTELWLSGT